MFLCESARNHSERGINYWRGKKRIITRCVSTKNRARAYINNEERSCQRPGDLACECSPGIKQRVICNKRNAPYKRKRCPALLDNSKLDNSSCRWRASTELLNSEITSSRIKKGIRTKVPREKMEYLTTWRIASFDVTRNLLSASHLFVYIQGMSSAVPSIKWSDVTRYVICFANDIVRDILHWFLFIGYVDSGEAFLCVLYNSRWNIRWINWPHH